MKKRVIFGACCVLALGAAGPLAAQEGGVTNELQQLREQLRLLRETFEREQAQHREQLEQLQRQIDALQRAGGPTAAAPTNAPVAGTSLTNPPALPASTSWSPAAPLTLVGNQRNYLNLSFDALVAAGGSTADDIERLEPGGHDPHQRGFTVQNLETVLDGAVDPYFRAQANLVFQVDTEGESTFEVEEAYAETMALPANLQVKAGQYLTEFGRLNPTHPHTWTFVDQPLINNRMFGPDGLRSPGVRVSWLTPTPFYSELFLGLQNSHGETAFSFRNPHGDLLFGRPAQDPGFSSLDDLLFVPRYAVSFNLTDTQTILGGVSGAFGPNASGHDRRTEIYGVDLFWKWKPLTHHGGFPFVSWQTEAMFRRYQAGAFSDPLSGIDLPSETLRDYGFYSQLAWGFRKGWVAGLRGDWVGGDSGTFEPDPDRDTRWRISPDLSWFPTEFSKLRLQYNYDDRETSGTDHSVWLQFEFMLGSHAAHTF